MSLVVSVESRADEPEFYTAAEAARLLGVSVVTVWRWINEGRLRAYRVGPRKLRINREDVESVVRPVRPALAVVEREQYGVAPAGELARRRALLATIVARRKERTVAPLTTADLVHRSREERGSYGS